MKKKTEQKINTKNNSQLFNTINENIIYELLKERFWEESTPVNKILKALSGSITLKKDYLADE